MIMSAAILRARVSAKIRHPPLPQGHFRLTRAFEISSNAAEAKNHFKDSHQIAHSIQQEGHPLPSLNAATSA
jgi:hypothetical protein